MTHEQKEAFRPEVLIKRLREVYGNLTPGAIDHADLDGMAFTVKEVIEALAASQPAPTADTGQVSIWGVWNGWAWETHGDEETARKHLSRNGERPVVEFRSVPAADAGQAVAWTEKGLREYAIKQGLPLRERASVPDLQRGGTIHPFHVEFRSEALVDLLNAQAHPAPLDAERVREARHHAVELEQCAIFAADVGDNIAKSMTDAAAFLKSLTGDKEPRT